MKPFTTHRGIVACIDRANIDTDLIIPKQFLKSISRTGFGEALFHDWRYLPDGKPNNSFLLNQAPFNKASILVAKNNFGCGSSREHAVWAVVQFGFRAVIAPSKTKEGATVPAFADIFRGNSVKNALLTIELKENEVNQIFEAVSKKPGLEATIDLAKQTVSVGDDGKLVLHFEIDPAVKERLLKGLDDIGMTLENENLIRQFEASHNTQR